MTVAAARGQEHRATGTQIDGEKAQRRQIGGGDDAARGDKWGNGSVDGAAIEPRQHAISQVTEIGGASAERLVFGGAITANLVVERLAPGDVGWSPAFDRRKSRRRDRVVFEARYLKTENAGCVIGGPPCQRCDLGRRLPHCGPPRGRLSRRIAAGPSP